jgi:hypothetical protein
MKRSLTGLVLGLCVVSTALATTYVGVEKDGTKTYSDRPMAGGVPIELEPAQSYSAPTSPGPSNLPRDQQLLQEMDDFVYTSCGVTPENDSTFVNPERVPIAIVATPNIRPFDTVIFLVNGQTVGQPGTISHVMSPVNRGTHTVSVTIKNRYGKLMCTSTSSFHVQRPSLNSPARR